MKLKYLLIVLALLLAACFDDEPKAEEFWTPTILNPDNAMPIRYVGDLQSAIDWAERECANVDSTEIEMEKYFSMIGELPISVNADQCGIQKNEIDSTTVRAAVFIRSDMTSKWDIIEHLRYPYSATLEDDMYMTRSFRIVDVERVKKDWLRVERRD